jgi:hypothetical protein
VATGDTLMGPVSASANRRSLRCSSARTASRNARKLPHSAAALPSTPGQLAECPPPTQGVSVGDDLIALRNRWKKGNGQLLAETALATVKFKVANMTSCRFGGVVKGASFDCRDLGLGSRDDVPTSRVDLSGCGIGVGRISCTQPRTGTSLGRSSYFGCGQLSMRLGQHHIEAWRQRRHLLRMVLAIAQGR